MQSPFWKAPLHLGFITIISAGVVTGVEPFTRPMQVVLAQETNQDTEQTIITDQLYEESQELEGRYFNTHQFEAATGQVLSIEMLSSEFSAFVVLVAPGREIIANDLAGDNDETAQIIITIPQGGEYTIVATSEEPGQLGEYSVIVRSANTEEVQRVEANRLFQQGIQEFQIGQFREAIASWEAALQRYRDIGDRWGEAILLGNLGIAYDNLGQYQTAIDYSEEYLAIAHEIGDRKGEVNALNNLGEAYRGLGQYQTAIGYYEQSLTIAREIGDRKGEANALGNLGLVYRSFGQYQIAIDYHEQQLYISHEIGDRQGEANSLGNLGLAYESLGQYEIAINYHEQSLAIKHEIGDRQGEANSLGNLGNAYDSLGQYETAIDYHKQQLAIVREIGDRRGEAASLANSGSAYLGLGQNETAIDYLEQSLTIAREIGDRQGEAIILGNLGLAYQNLGDYSTAIDYLEQGLALNQKIGDASGEGIVLSNLGILYQDQGQVNLAITFFKASVNVREDIRANIRELSQDVQQSYTNTISYTYRRLADLLIQQGRISEALQVLELLKASEIQEYTRGEILSPGSRDVDLFPEEEAIINTHGSLIALGRTIIDCEASGDCANLYNYYDQRTALTDKYNEVVGALNQDLEDRPGDTPPNPSALLGENVKRIVESQPNTVLIYPVVLDNEIWILWASEGGIADPIKVPISEAEVNRAVFEFQNLMQTCELFGCSEDDIPKIQAVAQELYSWLMPSQLDDELRANGIENLVFALDRTVRYIPMAALFDGEHYLIENYTISTVTAAWLTPESPLTGSEISVMALGLSEAVPANPEADLPGFNPLNNVPIELSAIVQSPESRSSEGIYPGVSYLNDRFDETTFYEVQGHSILHIATHGLFVPTALDSSFLVLGNKEAWRISQINNLKQFFTDLRLVVLSACETALGGRELNADGETDLDGREISGIAQSFMDAGADTVVASLWQVNDRSTSLLMQGFYQALAQEETPLTIAEAMRQTQLTMLYQGDVEVAFGNRGIALVPISDPSIAEELKPNYAHPYYWAPFIVIGNGLESLSGE